MSDIEFIHKTYKFKANKDLNTYDLARIIEAIELVFDETALPRVPDDLKKYFVEEPTNDSQ